MFFTIYDPLIIIFIYLLFFWGGWSSLLGSNTIYIKRIIILVTIKLGLAKKTRSSWLVRDSLLARGSFVTRYWLVARS
jgi:hypothetical protein